MPGELTRGVRVGYGLGSVATGAFGTVPGLLLLPYLTESLGVAAAVAGVVVFAARRRGTCCSTRWPDGSATAPVTARDRAGRSCCGPGSRSRSASRCCSPGPPLARRRSTTAWVAVLFLACATAYAFFQVPYVAMPAEITDDYAERTRLMTWRVAVLALAILVSGAAAPAIRDAVGGQRGLPRDGLLVAAADRRRCGRRRRRAPARLRSGGSAPPAAACAEQLGVVGRTTATSACC